MKSKKLFLVLFSLVALLLNFSSARAADEAVFGPKDCEIGSWHLYFSRDIFHLDAPGNGVIVVKKETSGADFSGGFLFLNWRLIPLRDFLRGEEQIVYKDVTLRSKNRLTVFLRGSPGTSVSIEVRRLDVPVPLPEITFTAEPMALVPGESATLAWETAYADIVLLDHGIGDVPPAGTLSVMPEETTTYVLAAIGPGGSSTATVTVSIDPLPPSLEVGIVPESIYEGEAAVLTWAAENADSCAIEPDIGVVHPEGSVTVRPMETTTYTVVASGPGGMDTAEATVTVVARPPTVEIGADPETIHMGETTVLSWGSTDADSCTIDPDVGVVPSVGSVTVTPQETTTYTITAVGPGGTAAGSVTVMMINSVPVAHEQSVAVDEDKPLSIRLSGSDADGDTLDYLIESGPDHGVLSGNVPELTYLPHADFYGEDSFVFVVEDVQAQSQPATVTIIVDGVNDAPIADAGPEQDVIAGDTVTLDGRGADVDGDPLMYEWAFTHVPAGSEATLSDPTSASPSFIADVPGEYVVQLIVADGQTQSDPDAVRITATPRMIVVPDVTTASLVTAESILLDVGLTVGTVSSENSDTVPTDHVVRQAPAAGSSVEEGSPVDLVVSLGPASTLPEVSFTASETAIQPGDSVTLTWNATNAETGFIQPDVGSVPASGTVTVRPLQTVRYEISVFGPSGCARDGVTVLVTGSPERLPQGSFGATYEDLIPPDATVDAYAVERFSVITGLVKDREGTPLSEVSVSILNQARYGTAVTDDEGRFSLPVEGGGKVIVVYSKDGLLPVHRKIYVPWNDIAVADTVVMIPQDPVATSVTFDGDPETVVTHQSTITTDGFGSRSCSMVFTGDNTAYMVDRKGNDVQEVNAFTARATEYPVPASMPARLPPTTAFTYCVELTVDGVSQARFEKPITVWVDNFLGFDVGDVVPVGWYDRLAGQWVPKENGVVVELLDENGDGVVDALDASGDGQADDLDGDGDPGSEVVGLSYGSHSPGEHFWRFATRHFSPFDLNWPTAPPADATGPTAEGEIHVAQQEAADCQSPCGSYAEARSRILHEDIPIPGTDMSLHYASNRVEGYRRKITVPVSGDTVPASLSAITVDVDVAGRTLRQTLPPLPNQVAEFTWDGLDYLKRPVKRSVRAHVTQAFVYDYVYTSAGAWEWIGAKAFAQPGAGTYATDIVARRSGQMSETSSVLVHVPTGRIAEGWTLSPHHRLSAVDMFTVHKGDGSLLRGGSLIIDTIAGDHTPGCGGDGGPATAAQIGGPREIAVGPDGSIYIAGTGCGVRRIDPEGIITTVAGGGNQPPYDGTPAIDADLASAAVAVGKDGGLFIATGNTVYRIDEEGYLFRYAGNGGNGFSGDNGPARDAQFNYIQGLAADSEGNVYIADKANYRIRRVTTDGTVTTVAGNGTAGYTGDGGPAVDAGIGRPEDVAVGPDGSVYIAASMRIRRVGPDGIIETVLTGYSPKGLSVDRNGDLYFEYDRRVYRVHPDGAIRQMGGTGERCYSDDLPCGDGGPASQAMVNFAWDVAVGPDGGVYLADSSQWCIRKIAPLIDFSPIWEAGDIPVMETSDVGYIMGSDGLHKETIDPETGVPLRTFHYNDSGALVAISDPFGNQTTIDRDMDGLPTAIVSFRGITTLLGIDEKNHLTTVTYPDGHSYAFEYSPEGLLTAKVEPAGNRFEYGFDSSGRLSSVTDEEGGHRRYLQSVEESGDILTEIVTAEGNVSSYLDRTDAFGAFGSTITDSAGAETGFFRSADGLTVNKSLPCGTELGFVYDIDPRYTFKYPKDRSVTTPSGLQQVTARERQYEDTNGDESTDRITERIFVNGQEIHVVHDILQATKTVTSPEGRTVTTQYDPSSLLPVSTRVPGLHETTYAYDALGRLSSKTTSSRETAFAYSPQGFLRSVTGPNGYTTSYEYDPVGRISRIDRSDGGSVLFAYDGNGNMTLLTNPLSIHHAFGYNAVNRAESYDTPLSGEYRYVYDKDRRLIQTIHPSGNQMDRIYADGRLVQVQTPEGNIDVTYLCGTRVDTIVKGEESIAYGYDGTLVTSETLSGSINQILSFGYNHDFNMSHFTYAGAQESYTYDNDGLLMGAGTFSIARNPSNGIPESVTDGTLNISRSFNGYGEIDSLDCRINSAPMIQWEVSRNGNGKVVQRLETVNGTSSEHLYTYDSVGRLLTVIQDGVLTEEYAYDANGARIYEMNIPRGISGRTYAYSEEDHLISAGDTTYDYDPDGFVTTKTTGSDVTTYDYSSRGELLVVNLPDGTTVEYTYDPLGRRIAKTINGVTLEKYLWQGLTRLLAVYDGEENLVTRFQYADDRMPLAMTRNGQRYYLAYDPIGSLRLVADTSGNIVKQIRYDTFGNVIDDTNPSFTIPLGFAGGLHDPHTALVHFGHRDYDPTLGRWTAKDPILFAGGNTDLYGYCLNDPVNLVDPEGLFHWGFGGAFGPFSLSWISADPTSTQFEILSDVEVGGGFSVTFDHPFPDVEHRTLPFSVNIGLGKWLGLSTDGDTFTISVGLAASLLPIDVSMPVHCPQTEQTKIQHHNDDPC